MSNALTMRERTAIHKALTAALIDPIALLVNPGWTDDDRAALASGYDKITPWLVGPRVPEGTPE